MKQFVIAGTLAGALAVGGTVLAQQPQPTAQTPAMTAGSQTDKPAKPRVRKSAQAGDTTDNASGTHVAPKAQPGTTDAANAQDVALVLGTVRLPKAVKADGKDLAAGSYQVRLTADEAKGDAKGSSPTLERWVEFTQKGEVKGREVVSIVPATETKLVQKDTPPHAGTAKVEVLKGGDYVRVWFNKGGNYYLVHLVP